MNAINFSEALKNGAAEAEQREVRPHGIELLTGPELATEEPEPVYLVRGLGMTGGGGAPHLIGGYGFSGKTMSCQQLALALASGKAVWGSLEGAEGKVLHLDLEQGRRTTKRRYARLARGMGIDLAKLGDRLTVAVRPDLPLAEEHRTRWIELMKGRTLLILDSLRAATAGIDENSSEIRSALDLLGGFSEVTGCRVLAIHHARKPSADAPGGDRYSIRGSSAIYDACDSVYVFSSQKGEPIRVECVKARDHGELVEPLAIEIVDVNGDRGPRDGLAIKLFGAERIDEFRAKRAAVAEAAALVKCRARVVDAVTRAHGTAAPLSSVAAIRERINGNKTLVNRAVQEAREAGEIHHVKNGRTGEYRPGREPSKASGTAADQGPIEDQPGTGSCVSYLGPKTVALGGLRSTGDSAGTLEIDEQGPQNHEGRASEPLHHQREPANG